MAEDFFESMLREQDLLDQRFVVSEEELENELIDELVHIPVGMANLSVWEEVVDYLQFVLGKRSLTKFLEKKGPHWYKRQFYPNRIVPVLEGRSRRW